MNANHWGSLDPFPHLVLDNFFDDDLAHELLEVDCPANGLLLLAGRRREIFGELIRTNRRVLDARAQPASEFFVP